MSVFQKYSAYYDLLYRDKDYDREVDYVNGLIRWANAAAKNILILGCGTGNHDLRFAELNYQVTGMDISQEMVAIARQKSESSDAARRPSYIVADIRTFSVPQKFDSVVALFHVMSYLPSNEDLTEAFRNVYRHLTPGGVFLFDCWYGPGVLTERPSSRSKVFEDDTLRVSRTSSPTLLADENCVNVHFDIDIREKATGNQFALTEDHKLRYLFTPEILLLSKIAGFELKHAEAWLTRAPLSFSAWHATYLCSK